MGTESDLQKEFLRFTKSDKVPIYLKGSVFVREVPLSYDPDESATPKDRYAPSFSMDFVEIDRFSNLHLWEAKVLHVDALTTGKVLGQMMFYDFLASTHSKESYLEILKRKGVPSEMTMKLAKKGDLSFATWNLLVLGGEGWELAAGVNPIMWTYPSINEMYFSENAPKLAVFHFYPVKDGYDLKNIWELSVYEPTGMHPEALERYHASRGAADELVQDETPTDEHDADSESEEESDELTLEMLLRFIGREAHLDGLKKG